MGEPPASRRERRRFERSVVGAPVEAVRREVADPDPHRIVGLHVLNMSRGGVGAMSQEALEPSERLTLFFPPMGARRGRDMTGEVVRCDDAGHHWAVGIAFEEPWPEQEEIPVV